MRRTVLMGACLLMMSGLVSASTIFALYGTGFTNTGAVVAAGGQDGNWTLVSDPSGSVSTPVAPFVTYGSSGGTFPFSAGAWLKDGSSGTTSEWVSPHAHENSSDPNSPTVPYVYQETFNLTGLTPSTVVITGEWSADNYGYIVVNGTPVSTNGTGADGIIANQLGQFKTFTSFILNASNATFQAGTNTIQFDVFNNPNGSPDVTGVNIDIESDFASDPGTPEPASFGLMGLGLVALALLGRRCFV